MSNETFVSPSNTSFIVFGLGGAGGKSLAEFAKMCQLNPTFGREVLSRTHFVLIDTDVRDLRDQEASINQSAASIPGLKMPEVHKLSLGQGFDNFEALVRHDESKYGWTNLPDNSPVMDAVWMRRDAAGVNRAFKAPRCAVPPSRGASQCPMISSYLAMSKTPGLDAILSRIRSDINELKEGSRTRLCFVTSLVGGTGRGAWWVVAARAKRFFPNSNPIGVFQDFSCFRDGGRIPSEELPRLKVNSLTGFAELAMWLRLGMAETKDASNVPNFTVPQLSLPQEVDPHSAIISTMLLANSESPTQEGTSQSTGRYPLRRAFVVTSESNGVVTPPNLASASILAGLLGIGKTDSDFNNSTQWAGTGMVSVAAVPLTELRRGVDLQVQSLALRSSLLADHEKVQNEGDVSSMLETLVSFPGIAVFDTYDTFRGHFFESGDGGQLRVKRDQSGVLGFAVADLMTRAPIGGLKECLEEQYAASEVDISEAIWREDATAVAQCMTRGVSNWVKDNVEADTSPQADQKQLVDDVVSSHEALAEWILRAVVDRCRHGMSDDLFSLAVHDHVLEASLALFADAIKTLKSSLRNLEKFEQARAKESASQPSSDDSSPRKRLEKEVQAASSRNGIIPIWPVPRYSEQEVTQICMRARYEFVRANLPRLLQQHVARLEAVSKALGRARSASAGALNRVKKVESEIAERASAYLWPGGVDAKSGKTRGVDGACRVLPRDSADHWEWLGKELKSLRSLRENRQFVLPRIVRSKDEFTRLDSMVGAASTVEKTVSRLAVDLMEKAGVRAIVEDEVDGSILKPEEIEKRRLDTFESGVRSRLGQVALPKDAEAKFEKQCALSQVLRDWASVIADIEAETISDDIYRATDDDCIHSLGFGLREARGLADPSKEAALLYRLARRLGDDTDDPALPVSSVDGKVRRDRVLVLVPGLRLNGVKAACAEDSPRLSLDEQLDYARAEMSFETIASQHVMFVTKWTLIPDTTFDELGWSVWQSFGIHTDSELRRVYLGGVDDPSGSSVFDGPSGAVGLGYTAPMFVRRPEFASRLWNPWRAQTGVPKIRRRSFALLYAMLGISDGTQSESTSSQSVEKFLSALSGLVMSTESPSLRWTMPIMGFDPGASILRWSLMRSPFQPIGTGATVDFRAPNDAAERQFNRLFKEGGGPVQFARALNSGEFDGFVDAVMAEHEVLMKLAARSPLMDHWNDAVRRNCGVYLRDMIQLRRTRVGDSNREHHQVQMAFYDGLEQTLDWLQKQGRGVLDPFVQ